jgi:hypothetical protein
MDDDVGVTRSLKNSNTKGHVQHWLDGKREAEKQ